MIRLDVVAAIAILACFGGFVSGSWVIHQKYMAEYDALAAEATAQIRAVEKANETLRKQYDKTLEDAAAVARANADRLDGLHDRLARACPAARSSGQSHDSGQGGGRGSVADSVDAVAGFAGRCARRADELAAQVEALQDYVRSLPR